MVDSAEAQQKQQQSEEQVQVSLELYELTELKVFWVRTTLALACQITMLAFPADDLLHGLVLCCITVTHNGPMPSFDDVRH